jgi:hypothetical protein
VAAMDGVECAAEEGYAHSVMLEQFLNCYRPTCLSFRTLSVVEGEGICFCSHCETPHHY